MNDKINKAMDDLMWNYRGIIGIALFSAMLITMSTFVYMLFQSGVI